MLLDFDLLATILFMCKTNLWRKTYALRENSNDTAPFV